LGNDSCCGFGGTFNIKKYKDSKEVGKNKAQEICTKDVKTIFTACPGCAMQLSDLLAETDVAVEHPLMHIAKTIKNNGGFMPHLQFEFNFELKKKEKKAFAKSIMDKFSEIMDTTTGHIAITIREYKSGNLQLGRVKDINEKMAFVNADIREGRTYEKRRMLAVAFMDEIKRYLNVPENNMYVIITEHKGEDFHLYERALKNWTPEEDPLND